MQPPDTHQINTARAVAAAWCMIHYKSPRPVLFMEEWERARDELTWSPVKFQLSIGKYRSHRLAPLGRRHGSLGDRTAPREERSAAQPWREVTHSSQEKGFLSRSQKLKGRRDWMSPVHARGCFGLQAGTPGPGPLLVPCGVVMGLGRETDRNRQQLGLIGRTTLAGEGSWGRWDVSVATQAGNPQPAPRGGLMASLMPPPPLQHPGGSEMRVILACI